MMEQQMSAQTQFSPQDDKKDRKLTITVTPTLHWNSTDPLDITASIAFAASDCKPADTATVDSATGKIDISHMPRDTGYNENIDIKLSLDTSKMKDANGNPLTGKATPRWAKDDEGPTYTDSKGKTKHLGFGWFCKINDLGPPLDYDVSPPISIDKMKFKRSDGTELLIDDDTPDASPAYAFMMAFVLPGSNDYYISIDPILTNKGLGSNDSFMLKK